jgi:hypothetical protein
VQPAETIEWLLVLVADGYFMPLHEGKQITRAPLLRPIPSKRQFHTFTPLFSLHKLLLVGFAVQLTKLGKRVTFIGNLKFRMFLTLTLY